MVFAAYLPNTDANVKERRIERIYYRVKMSVGLFLYFPCSLYNIVYLKRFSDRNHVSERRFFPKVKRKRELKNERVCPMIF